ncbi:MAG: hypothetical protein QW767_04140 [Thermoprotei archaeon]
MVGKHRVKNSLGKQLAVLGIVLVALLGARGVAPVVHALSDSVLADSQTVNMGPANIGGNIHIYPRNSAYPDAAPASVNQSTPPNQTSTSFVAKPRSAVPAELISGAVIVFLLAGLVLGELSSRRTRKPK